MGQFSNEKEYEVEVRGRRFRVRVVEHFPTAPWILPSAKTHSDFAAITNVEMIGFEAAPLDISVDEIFEELRRSVWGPRPGPPYGPPSELPSPE